MRKLKRRKKYNKKELYLITEDFNLLDKNISPKLEVLIYICKGDPKLAIYLSHLIRIGTYILHEKKIYSKWVKKDEGWFFILNEKLFQDIWFMNINKSIRNRLDKKLEKLDIIETKCKGPKNRKYYRINTKKIKQGICGCENATPDNILYITKVIYNKTFSDEKVLLRNLLKQKTQVKNKIEKTKTRLITRKPIEEIISHWSDKGPPFAKVRKKESIYPVLKKLVKSNQPREIIRVIDIGHKYFSDPLFLFNNGNKLSIKPFFERSKFNSYQSNFIGTFKVDSWFKLFQTKDNSWLNEKLLKVPKIKDQETYSFIKEFFGSKNNDPIVMKIVSNKMYDWTIKNNYPLRTMTIDINNFIRDKYPDISKFKLYWMKGDKFWNEQFAKYLVEFGRYKDISEIKEV
jgi:hypothetical protein